MVTVGLIVPQIKTEEVKEVKQEQPKKVVPDGKKK